MILVNRDFAVHLSVYGDELTDIVELIRLAATRLKKEIKKDNVSFNLVEHDNFCMGEYFIVTEDDPPAIKDTSDALQPIVRDAKYRLLIETDDLEVFKGLVATSHDLISPIETSENLSITLRKIWTK